MALDDEDDDDQSSGDGGGGEQYAQNYFDQLDATTQAPPPVAQQQGNYFDQFDAPAPQAQGGNYFDQFDQQKPPEAESPFWTTLRHVAHGLLPSAAGLAAIPGGIAAGAAIGLPEAGIGAIPGAFIGGGLAYMGARAAQDTGAKLMGFGDDLQMAADDAANPKSAAVGDILSAAPFLGPGAAPAAVRAGGALFGAGMEAFNQWKSGESPDWSRLAIAGAGGALLTTPTRAGEAIGSRAAAAIGRPELWHGTPGSDAAAGTAKEQPPPAGGTPGEGGAAAATPEATAPAGDRTGPEDFGKEAPPPAAVQQGGGTEGLVPDPALDAAIRAKMEPGGEAAAPPPEQPAGAAEPEIPTATSAKLEAQFPRTPPGVEGRPLTGEPAAPVQSAQPPAAAQAAIANSKGFSVRWNPDEFQFEAVSKDGKVIGHLLDAMPEKGTPENPAFTAGAEVDEPWRRKGVASALYDAFAAKHDGNIAPAGNTSREAWDFWLKKYPDKTADYVKQQAADIAANARSGNFDPEAFTDQSIRNNYDHPKIQDMIIKELRSAEQQAQPASPREAIAQRAPGETVTSEPSTDPLQQRINEATTAPSPAAHLRETAAMYREQGQEGRARQLEQGANAIERSQQQQQQQRQQPPRQPPGGRPPGTPPKPPRVPKEQLVEQGKLGDEQAFNLANKADDELNKLSTIPAADMLRYKGLGEEASKMHPEIKGKGGETIYNAIVNGTYDKLPANLRAGFEHATGDISKENAALRKELVDRGLIDNEANDPRYMKRVMKSAPVRVDDPITEGHIGRLPGMHDPSSTKELAFYGAQDKDGNRLVLAGKGDRIAVMKNREPEGFITNPKETSPQTGDKLTYNGKEYTVDRGRENEIEQHAVHEGGTPVEYHKNAFVSKFVENRELRMMKDYNDWLDRFKDPEKSPFKSLMTRDADTAKKRGWPQSGVPDLQGLYMHPDLEQVIHNNYKPGMGMPDINWLRVANQLGVRSIFWNPVPHAMNAFMHYLVGRGTDWIDPRKYGTLAKSVIEGFKAAYTQDQLLQDINRAGGSLIQSKIYSQNIVRNLGKAFDADLRNNPGKWEQYARTYGLGHGIDAVKLWYEHAGEALWTFSDALMGSRIRELEMNGMSREDAIASARVHMPDYRLPIKILGSRQMVRFMSDPNVSVFGRYHMGMLNSLSTMMTHTLGPNATMAERKEALGNVFALAAIAFVLKPALDKAVQSITGNKDAEVKPRGPLAPLTGAYGVATGKKDLGMVLSNVFTLSPAINAIRAGLSNRDFAGRRIVDPGSPWYDKFGQAAEFATGTLVSPYSTFGPTIQPGSARGSPLHEFLSQITDTKVPTQKEVAGQRYGQKLSLKEAKTRAQHPRGLIEYGLGQLTR